MPLLRASSPADPSRHPRPLVPTKAREPRPIQTGANGSSTAKPHRTWGSPPHRRGNYTHPNSQSSPDYTRQQTPRYLKIVRPSGTHVLQSVRAANIVSMVTWICLLALSVPYTILFFITQKPLTSIPNHCGLLFSASVSLMFKIIHTLCTIIFLLVSISLVFFYYSISRRVFQAQQSQLASSGSEKLVKSRRNMLVLVSIFCVCFVPYHLVRVPFVFLLNTCSVEPVLYYLMEAATMVSVFNVCLDPLVYFFLCKSFRAQVNRRMVSIRTNIQQANQEN